MTGQNRQRKSRKWRELMDSEFDQIDVCVNCKIREFCDAHPECMYCEDVMRLAGIIPAEEEE